MGWIGCVHCEKFQCDLMAQTSPLIATVQPIFTVFRVVTKHCEMHRNITKCSRTWVYFQWGGSSAFFEKKFRCDFMAQTCALVAPFQPFLHRVSCNNKTLINAPKHYENAPKHEFRVQWGGSRAFVAKNSMRFRTTNFCIYVQPVLHQVLCSNETNPKCT